MSENTERNVKIKIILSLIVAFLFFPMGLFAFEWPMEIESLNDIRFFFLENRKTFISPSLVFPKGETIFLSEAGKNIFRFEKNSYCGQFPSTLGNALVIAHENDMRSIYANLGEFAIDETKDFLQGGSEIALSGHSGWHEEESGLEFIVIDTKNKTLINPLLVLPMNLKALDFSVGKLFLKDIRGEYRELANGKSFEEGVYILYRETKEKMPFFKNLVSLNGNTLDSLNNDSLSLWDKKLVLKTSGGTNLDFETNFPREGMQYVCEVKLSRGKSTLIVQIFDIFANKKQIQYTFDVK